MRKFILLRDLFKFLLSLVLDGCRHQGGFLACDTADSVEAFTAFPLYGRGSIKERFVLEVEACLASVIHGLLARLWL